LAGHDDPIRAAYRVRIARDEDLRGRDDARDRAHDAPHVSDPVLGHHDLHGASP
jgi:hypothetical protein